MTYWDADFAVALAGDVGALWSSAFAVLSWQ